MYKVPNYSEVKLLSLLFHWKMRKNGQTGRLFMVKQHSGYNTEGSGAVSKMLFNIKVLFWIKKMALLNLFLGPSFECGCWWWLLYDDYWQECTSVNFSLFSIFLGSCQCHVGAPLLVSGANLHYVVFSDIGGKWRVHSIKQTNRVVLLSPCSCKLSKIFVSFSLSPKICINASVAAIFVTITLQ